MTVLPPARLSNVAHSFVDGFRQLPGFMGEQADACSFRAKATTVTVAIKPYAHGTTADIHPDPRVCGHAFP